MGEPKRALAAPDKAIALKPDYAFAYESRAITYSALGDDRCAVVDASRTIELDGRGPRAYNVRGNAYYKLKDFARAEADYAACRKLGGCPRQ